MPVLQKRLHSWAAGWLGWGLLSAMHATWKVQVLDPHGLARSVRDGCAAVVVAFWHRHILSALTEFAKSGVCVPVSEHQDGEYVAQVMERFGLVSVRGSTTRGAVRLLRGLLREAREGRTLAVTPDGPRGPKFSVQPGVAMLARRSGRPVLPLGIAAEPAWTMASWDEFVVPRPWARVVIVAGEPVQPDVHEDISSFCVAVRRALFDATDCARAALRPAP